MSDSFEFKCIWETTDYVDRTVVFTEDRLQHIVNGRMAQVGDQEWPRLIRAVIEAPDLVLQDQKYDDTEVHCRYDFDSSLPGIWLNVPVLYQVGGYGDVRTAIPVGEQKKSRKILFMKDGLWT